MKIKSTLVLALGLGLTLASCSDNADKSSSIAFESFQKGATYVLEGSAKDFGTSADILFYDSVSMVMPQRLNGYDISELRDSITSLALGQKKIDAMVPAIDKFLKATADDQGYKARKVNSQDIPMGYAYVNGYVVYLTPELLVYCVDTEIFNPGNANGMHTKQYLNYELSQNGKGNLLSISQMFTPEGLKQLSELIAERAQDMSDVIGPTSVDGLPENGNFFISSEGQIVFAYQPAEIGSSAQGFINVAFEFPELYQLFSPKAISFFGLEGLESVDSYDNQQY